MALPYRRVLLKLSGEALMGSEKSGISGEACLKIALAIKALQRHNVQVAVVIGGGNIFRGVQAKELNIPRTSADYMGMLATLINGIALQETLIANDCPTKVMSALECPRIAKPFAWHQAMEYLQKGINLIFVGGTGHPYFTTDTTAALRASEIQADLFLKATKVNGIYDKDPLKHSKANKYETMSYSQVLAEKLEVIDATAIALCRDHQIPIFVFNMETLDQDKILEVLSHHNGTLVKGG